MKVGKYIVFCNIKSSTALELKTFLYLSTNEIYTKRILYNNSIGEKYFYYFLEHIFFNLHRNTTDNVTLSHKSFLLFVYFDSCRAYLKQCLCL